LASFVKKLENNFFVAVSVLRIGYIVLQLGSWHIAKQTSNLFDEKFYLLVS